MKRYLGFALVLLLVVAPACGHKKVKYDAGAVSGSSEADGKGLSASVSEVKPKKKAIDVFMTLTNHYKNGVTFKKSAIKMTLDGEAGSMLHSGFSGDMAAGASETERVTFGFEKGKHEGNAVLTVDPIWSESEGGGKGKKLPPLTVNIPIK